MERILGASGVWDLGRALSCGHGDDSAATALTRFELSPLTIDSLPTRNGVNDSFAFFRREPTSALRPLSRHARVANKKRINKIPGRRNALADEEALLAFDDGLVRPEVGGWTEEKHRHVSLYSRYFLPG